MELDVEVYREDVDALAQALSALVQEHVGALPYIDRAIIVAAALGNVACTVDAVEPTYTAECTTRLQRVAASWTSRGAR